MSDDIIRIDGVEYEKVAFTNTKCSGLAGSLGNGECIVALRPKRKQTPTMRNLRVLEADGTPTIGIWVGPAQKIEIDGKVVE